MPITVNLDVMMARRHIGAGELADKIGITPANLSILKNKRNPCTKRVQGFPGLEPTLPSSRTIPPAD